MIDYLDVAELDAVLTDLKTNFTSYSIIEQFYEIDFENIPSTCCSNGTELQILFQAAEVYLEILNLITDRKIKNIPDEMITHIRFILQTDIADIISEARILITKDTG